MGRLIFGFLKVNMKIMVMRSSEMLILIIVMKIPGITVSSFALTDYALQFLPNQC
jgi:hypothetical protein